MTEVTTTATARPLFVEHQPSAESVQLRRFVAAAFMVAAVSGLALAADHEVTIIKEPQIASHIDVTPTQSAKLDGFIDDEKGKVKDFGIAGIVGLVAASAAGYAARREANRLKAPEDNDKQAENSQQPL